MNKIPVIAIFDVGKTNKKLLLFNEQYELLQEDSRPMDEITDEDGFPCDDVQALASWIRESYTRLLSSQQYEVKGINFSGYGASFVYIGVDGRVMLPLYNYLKPYPKPLLETFYAKYGGRRSCGQSDRFACFRQSQLRHAGLPVERRTPGSF
jgi:L-fuculokinase